MSKVGSEYKPFYPTSKPHPEFPACNKHHLVKTLDELKQALSTRGDYIAWDTETSSLSPEEGEIVGFSFSFSPYEGWYVPVNHIGCSYNLGHAGLEIFYERILQCKKTFVYNMRFDFRFMEYAGFDMSKVRYFDVSVAVFMADTNVRMLSLKKAQKIFAGWEPSTFEETLGDATSFQYLDPEEGYRYACADCEATFMLAGATAPYYKEAKFCCDLDNAVLYPLMKFEDLPLKVDIPYLKKVVEEETRKISELEREIYEMVGYEFSIKSNKQLGEALQSVGVNTGKFTAKGLMKTDIKTLALIKSQHPVLEKIIDYSKRLKAVSSYFESTANQAEKHNGGLRFSYLTSVAPTGRLACGSDAKNSYFAHLNIQSAPKPHPRMWYVHDYHSGDEVRPGEEVIDRWLFSVDRPSDYMIEGFDQKANFRSAFTVDEGCYWVSQDFSGEELRLTANVSNERGWIETMLHGGDLHRFMAEQMWGKENYNKELRKRAKTANFGLIYGMSPFSMPDKFGEPLEVCQEIYEKFWKAVPNIKAFQEKSIRRARRVGTIYNYLGRPRRVKYWFNSGNGKDYGFACRTCANTVIQSMGGEILKIALLKLWKNLYNVPKYRDAGVRFFSTIHDEVNSQVPASMLREVLKIKRKCMDIKFPNWDLPIECSCEIGNRWGCCFPFEWTNDDEVIRPKMEPVKK